MDQRLLYLPYDRSVPMTTISTWCDPRCPQRPHIGLMPHLDMSDDEAAALMKELHDTVHNDPHPPSPRFRTLKDILARLRLEPVREPLPPPKFYAPPRATAVRRQRAGLKRCCGFILS
jgi:hypothetical protein